jgi:3-oxoacyl-[acyl-carrier protein] reductase
VGLEGKIAVVTGGGSGLGEAICIRLAREGARVAVLDVNEDAAKLTAELVGGVAVQADVSDSSSVDLALEQAEAALAPVDIWVNNAGIAAVAQAERITPLAERQLEEAAEGEITTPLDALVRLPDEEWRKMLAVHLDGTFYGTRAAARSMAARGAGVIVNIASVCGVEGCTGYPHYSAAKAGVLGFTRAVAKELILQGIRVNAVAPGTTLTEHVAAVFDENHVAAIVESTPLRRMVEHDELARLTVFLASDLARCITGQLILADAGAFLSRSRPPNKDPQ